MAPSYEQNTAKIGEIHGTMNLGFKRPVHEGYIGHALRALPIPPPLALCCVWGVMCGGVVLGVCHVGLWCVGL